MTVSTDFERDYVLTGNKGQINAVKLPDLQYTKLGKLILYRLMHDRDVKILITGRGKTTGTGKTTLAIHLARWVNAARNEIFDTSHEWSAEEYSFMDVWEYLERYRDSAPGDCLITDELEYMTDARRWMTDQNVKFSQAWSILRYKNVVTIGTAPGMNDLEKRVKETADVWIRVMNRGEAAVYYMTFDDFEHQPVTQRLRQGGFKESIHWSALDDDPDYEWLASQKEDLGVPGLGEKDKQLTQGDVKEAKRKFRDKAVKGLIQEFTERDLLGARRDQFSQKDIAALFDVSQQTVSKLKKELEKDGELPA